MGLLLHSAPWVSPLSGYFLNDSPCFVFQFLNMDLRSIAGWLYIFWMVYSSSPLMNKGPKLWRKVVWTRLKKPWGVCANRPKGKSALIDHWSSSTYPESIITARRAIIVDLALSVTGSQLIASVLPTVGFPSRSRSLYWSLCRPTRTSLPCFTNSSKVIWLLWVVVLVYLFVTYCWSIGLSDRMVIDS